MNILMHVDIDKSHVNDDDYLACMLSELVRNFTHVENRFLFFLHDNEVLHVEMIYTTTKYTIILNEHKYTHFPLKLYYLLSTCHPINFSSI